MKKNKLINIIFLIINIIFILCMSFIITSCVINNDILFKDFNILIIIIGVLIYFLIIFILYKLLKKINLSINKIFIICMIIYLFFQLLTIIFLKVNPSWDFEAVFNIVSNSLNGETSIASSIYLYQFQNNVIYAYLLKFLLLPFAIFKISNFLIPAMIINAIILDIGIIFIYKTIKLLFNDQINKLFIILLFAFQPILLYVPIIYTDTMAFCFVAIILYLTIYLLSFENKDNRKISKDLIVSALLGIFFGIGMQVKFTIVILLIAFIIIILFKKGIKQSIKNISIILTCLLLVTIVIKVFINIRFDKETLNQNQVPITHWIMMGLSNYGNYNAEDYKLTFQSGDYNDKIEFNKKETSKRLKDHINKHDLIKFYTKKTAYLWNDGSYYLPELLRLAENKNIIHEFVLSDGKYFNIYIYYLQIKHMFMLITLLLIPILSKGEKDNKVIKNYLLTAIIGYFLFFMIWEVSSRYLFHILPLLLITSFYSINLIIKKISSKLKRVN